MSDGSVPSQNSDPAVAAEAVTPDDARRAALAANGWVEVEDSRTHKKYYYNKTTKQTTWSLDTALSKSN
jgi:hypothetical protein